MDTYEKKYKEALESARKLRVQNPFDTVSQMMEHVFPELKESEDEKIKKALMKFIEKIPYERLENDGVSIKEALAWLEKQAKHKPAWNREDDYNVQCMIAKAVNDIRNGNVGRNNELIDWLKSLKERYTWKPSEEQTEALRDINLTGNISYAGQGQVLIELYNDLKKLKE